MNTYVVLGYHSWDKKIFDSYISCLPGKWVYICNSESLTVEYIDSLSPRYLFFLHWSWIVPSQIHANFECVCFHMTDVPFGIGGSPLQNLILRGYVKTKLTALRMTEDIDSGPVYMKRELSLAGRAQSIYARASRTAARMIKEIIRLHPTPIPQEGVPTYFKRRMPDQSLLPSDISSLQDAYDYIRMLDADGYPRAFIAHGRLKITFSDPSYQDGKLVAQVQISNLGGKQ